MPYQLSVSKDSINALLFQYMKLFLILLVLVIRHLLCRKREYLMFILCTYTTFIPTVTHRKGHCMFFFRSENGLGTKQRNARNVNGKLLV